MLLTMPCLGIPMPLKRFLSKKVYRLKYKKKQKKTKENTFNLSQSKNMFVLNLLCFLFLTDKITFIL